MDASDFLIFDFDNTIIQGESLEMLAEVSLRSHPRKEEIYSEIVRITSAAMNGTCDFGTALTMRLALLELNEGHILDVIEEQKKRITPSFLKNSHFLKSNANKIYIISGGFRELILPIAYILGLRADHVYANDLLFNFQRQVMGIQESNILSKTHGKAALVASLNLKGKGLIIGDGMTDFEIAASNTNCTFYAFTENIKQPELLKKGCRSISSIDSLVTTFNDVVKKDTPEILKVLLLENVDSVAMSRFRESGFVVESLMGACNELELIQKISDVHFLGIRSKTHVTEKVLLHAKNLLGIGAFCIGTDQIQLDKAASKGIAVFNAPFSSTRSVVELTMGLIIMLSRNVFFKSNALHQGIWDKSSNSSCEIRGKTLGIVGYGNIGSQLSILAENMGMHVLYYDRLEKVSHGNVQKTNDLETLLRHSDIVTVHIDGRAENANTFGEIQFMQMKEGSIFLNLSRGHIVDIKALGIVLHLGKLKGAALDVYPNEPNSNNERFINELQNMPNVILTPHIGGSTLEAQKNIAETIFTKFMDYFERGTSLGSVNFPPLSIPPLRLGLTRIFHIHANVPGVLAAINGFFAKWHVNVDAQYLGTQDNIGYVVTDVSHFKDQFFSELQKVPHTIKVRRTLV